MYNKYLKKIDHLSITLQEEPPDCVIFTEHGIKEDDLVFFNINGYSLINSFCRKDHKSGGVIILIRDSSKPLKINVLSEAFVASVEMHFEIVGVQIDFGFLVVNVFGVYRTHDSDFRVIGKLEDLLAKSVSVNKKTIFLAILI